MELSQSERKDLGRSKSQQGFKYQGEWDGFFHYTKRNEESYGYYHIRATLEDLRNGEIELMIKYGVTR